MSGKRTKALRGEFSKRRTFHSLRCPATNRVLDDYGTGGFRFLKRNGITRLEQSVKFAAESDDRNAHASRNNRHMQRLNEERRAA